MHSGERKRPFNSTDSDLISKLPSNIVDNILIRLPLKEAARTSVLSREWRFKWRYIPELVLVGEGFQGRTYESPRDYWLQIYQILLLHRGPLNKFVVYLRHDRAAEICLIDQLILFLSEKDVRELNLRCYFIETGDRDHRHRLPSTLFQCLQLTHLSLEYYTLRLPPQFIGFSRLIIIRLYWVEISGYDFKTFISKCPVLEKLTLQELVVDDNTLEIDARNLKLLHIYDFDGSILLKNVPVLSKFAIESRRGVEGSMPNIVSLSRSLPTIENFRATQKSLTDFSGGVIPQRLPNMFNYLKFIELIGLSFNTPKQIKCALLLISSSPNLEKLKIKSHAEDVDITSILLDQEALSLVEGDSFSKLQEVKLQNFNGTVPELEFLEIILVKSLALKKMTIHLAVEKCSVSQDSLTDFSGGVIPQRLANMFNHLKFIELFGLNFNTPKHIKCALLLISSSPNLEKLKIKSHLDITSIFRHQEALSLVDSDSFSKLQEVELEEFNGTVPELDFLEIILLKSLVLKKITIRLPRDLSDKEKVRILKAIIEMERGSPKAKFRFIDRCELF